MAHKKYIVKPGDCIDSIAYVHGFFSGTLWNHPANAELKKLRSDPNILFPGDVVVIPDKEPKHEDCTTETLHRFRLLGVPARFRLQLLKGGKPRANLPFRIDIDGALQSGLSDEKGVIDIPLPSNAQRGMLYLEEDNSQIELRFGRLAPISEALGVRQRLANLGFLDDAQAADEEAYKIALQDFQARCSLPQAYPPDQATRNKLVEIHDHPNTVPQEEQARINQ